METNAYLVQYQAGRFVLTTLDGTVVQVLGEGDTLELFEYGWFCRVEVCSGGYGGWYYVTADGRPARFAIGLRAQNYRAKCSSI